MPHIRPVSDLRNNFAEISKIVHETLEPVFLTKNGHGDMVVMSIEQYENIQYNNEIFAKLKEAEIEANNSDIRFGHDEVFKQLRQRLSKEEKE
ncbi:type II toxin-antitoxin system Phd/YefM family antitoxin [Paenibacillus sp. HN-1]|uniref:type II toxin-antitoxin system Phd/YefM family antitoxin n=1 Tax=Paenibacillus sinensis TaxID=2834413 RepID=UPI001CA831B0|nr:type II toxin-antitoxin system Phd/YefM family antitoxin [Paenibacillus sinensis]MBY9082214.1 type II toxin-antitoxin system Phd/YefM family antitoxin [Paenibacillus sp. CGMCC 1.18879]MBY9086408.1 type II toxin-antitoxin system Phd/YefM family antitoxin [Paenibacillus sinensis]